MSVAAGQVNRLYLAGTGRLDLRVVREEYLDAARMARFTRAH